MKYNKKLVKEIEYFKKCVILVEGKKDVASLRSLGFERVYAIHQTGISLKERIEQILLFIGKNDIVCILTDFDKKGKQLYLQIKFILQERGVKVNSSLRGLFLKANVSHIEGLNKFMEKLNKI